MHFLGGFQLLFYLNIHHSKAFNYEDDTTTEGKNRVHQNTFVLPLIVDCLLKISNLFDAEYGWVVVFFLDEIYYFPTHFAHRGEIKF